VVSRNRIIISSILCLIIFFGLCILSEAIAKDKKKRVILSTVDIDEDYEILGLVYYRSSELNPKKIHAELRKQAEKMDADYVIGITYYNNAGYLYGSGTAVRLIEEDK
jgi:hypothetical protein